MGDVMTRWSEFGGDWVVDGIDAASDDGLETAIILSLFTDRRAEPEDDVTFRRGWWGDALPSADGDLIGSRLWLLRREKTLESVRLRAKAYAEEALKWLVDDRIARAVSVRAELLDRESIAIEVEVQRRREPAKSYQFVTFWGIE